MVGDYMDDITQLKYNTVAQYQNTVDDLFFTMLSPQALAPYQLIKRWLQWANGYVPEWHNNVIPTHLGRTIIQLLTNKIIDTGLKYEISGGDKEKQKTILQWLSDVYAEESNFELALSQVLTYGQSSGTSLVKYDIDAFGMLSFSGVRQDRFRVVFSGSKPIEVETYVSVLDGNYPTQKLILVEKRYYNEQLEPCGKYFIRILNNQTQANTWASGNVIDNVAVLKDKTLETIKAKLGKKELGKEYKLPFKHLGILVYRNTPTSAFFDGMGVGDSTLANAIELLAEYDRSYTLMCNDLALGRGQVLLPDNMLPKITTSEKSDMYTYMSMLQQMLNTTMYKYVPSINPEEQKPISIQFELRAQEWATSLNTQLQEILVRIMASPSSVAPFLNDGSMKTATEINAIEHNTVNYINEKRRYIKKIANQMLKDVFEYYNKEGNAFVVFNSPGLNNDQQMSEKAIKEYNAGVRSLKSTIKACNPSWTEQEVQEEIERLEAEEMPLADEDIIA